MHKRGYIVYLMTILTGQILGPDGPETKNDYADENQRQFIGLEWTDQII